MSNNLAQFEFESQEIRVAVKDGLFWFVANDICRVLEIENTSDALTKLKPYEKDGIDFIDTTGRTQNMRVVSESGLYRLILRSNKPQAEPFQDWVCQEVLPSIRKTGQYKVNNYSVTPQPNLLAIERSKHYQRNGFKTPSFTTASIDLVYIA